MEFSYPPAYKDKMFWLGFACTWAAHGHHNYFTGTRPFARLHIGLITSVLGGYIGYSIARHIVERKFRLGLTEQLQEEIFYQQSLGRQQGKFLENNEGQIKEVFRTIIF